VKNAFAIFNNAIFTVKIAGKSLDTAEINFDRSSELFNLGQITTTQFREAQLNLVRAEIRMINEKFTAKFAEVELYRLSGHLPEISSK
jgi:outer membrane protein TolC